MKLSRRDAIRVSGRTVAGLSGRTASWRGHSANGPSFRSTRMDPPPSTGPRKRGRSRAPSGATTGGEAPEIDYNYRNMEIRLDSRGLAGLGGTRRFSDLEDLPRHSYTTLLQCGAPQPTGIVKWTGVRFSDFAAPPGLPMREPPTRS